MNSDDLILLAVAGVAAYLLWNKETSWTPQTLRTALAGTSPRTEVYSSSYVPGATMANIDGTTYRFREGDENRLNWAQKTLITLDKIIPGTTLTRWALE